MKPEIQYRLVTLSPLRDRAPIITLRSMMADYIADIIESAPAETLPNLLVVEVNIGAPQRPESEWKIAGVDRAANWLSFYRAEQEQKTLAATWLAEYTADQNASAAHDAA